MVRDSNIYEYFLDSIRRKLLSLLHAIYISNETNFNLSLIQWRNAPPTVTGLISHGLSPRKLENVKNAG